MKLLIVVAVAVCGMGCKEKRADKATVTVDDPAKPTAPAPAPGIDGPVICASDAAKFELEGWPVSLGGRMVQVAIDPTTKNIVVSAPSSAKVLGTLAVPAGARNRIKGATETREGLAVFVTLAASPDDGGALQLARFNADGSPHGGLVAVPESAVHYPMPGFDVGSFDDTLVLFEETKSMSHSQVQLMDLDLKLIGDPVDTGRGRIGHYIRIGRSHVFALFLRDRESDTDMLRIFDADKRAWLGPQFATGQPNVYGEAAFGEATVVMMGVGPSGVSGATLDATGKLGAWKSWASSEDSGGRGVVTTPDGKHTFAVWTTGRSHDEMVHIATVKPDLSLANEHESKVSGFSSTLFADNTAIYESATRYTCTPAK